MTKHLTVSGIRAQIAVLEAKAASLAAVETKTSVAKVRALMDSLGVTLEHLQARASKAAKSSTRAIFSSPASHKKTIAKRTATKTARYADPATGATWSGLGRAPAWINSAENRDDYLVDKAKARLAVKKVARDTNSAAAPQALVKKKASAPPAGKKVARKAAPRKRLPAKVTQQTSTAAAKSQGN